MNKKPFQSGFQGFAERSRRFKMICAENDILCITMTERQVLFNFPVSTDYNKAILISGNGDDIYVPECYQKIIESLRVDCKLNTDFLF